MVKNDAQGSKQDLEMFISLIYRGTLQSTEIYKDNMSEEIELQSLKTIVKGAGIVFIGLIISKFLTYSYRVFIARYFGPSDYGLFSVGLAVIGFLGIFALLGLPTGIVRYVAYYKAKSDEQRIKGVITTSLKIVFPVSVLFSLLLFISSPYLAINIFHNSELIDVLRILSLSIPFSSLFYIFVSTFVGFQEIKYQVYSECIFSNSARLIFIILSGLLGLGIFGIAWAWTLATISTFLLSFYFLEKRVFSILRTKVTSIPLKKELLFYSLPLLLAGFMSFIVRYTDTLMLGYFKTPVDVGIYNAALPTAQLLLMTPTALTSLFFPVITSLHVKGRGEELERVYKTVTRWIFYINFPLFLLLIFFSKQVLNIMFGPVYTAGYLVLMLLSVGYILSTFGHAPYHALNMLKKTKVIMYVTMICASLNVILNFLLIPLYGIEGAAFATATTYVSQSLLLVTFSLHIMRITPFSFSILKSFLAGILSIIFIYLLARLLFVSFPIYVLIIFCVLFLLLYGFLLLLFRGFRKEDIEILKAIERKSGIRVEFLREILKKFI